MSDQQPSNPYGGQQPMGSQPPAQPTDPYAQPADPYADGQSSGAGATPVPNPGAQPTASPFGQTVDPYAQPGDPYGQQATPYAPDGQQSQPVAGYGQSAPVAGYTQPADPYQPAGDPYAQGADGGQYTGYAPQPGQEYAYAQPSAGQQAYPAEAYGQFQPYASNPYGATAGPRPEVSFNQSLKAMFQNFATFKGRASVSEYLAPGIIYAILWIVSVVLNYATDPGEINPLMALVGLLNIIFFLPLLSALVRRLHDQNKSGWLALLGLIPIVNILLLVWGFTGKSDPAGARFDDPLGKQPATGA